MIVSINTKNSLAFFVVLLICFPIILQAQYFTNANSIAGIDHFHEHRSHIGGGACFFDYDLDGDEDLYMTGGLSKDHLYRNNGDGTFTNVTDQAGFLKTESYNTISVVSGDIDNDGYRELFITTREDLFNFQPSRNLYYKNNGNGTFTEISQLVGFNEEAFSAGATFMDANQDGFLDLFVINYVESSGFTYDENNEVNGFAHICYENYFYLNNGDGTFNEMGATLGVNDTGCSLGVTATDYDMDDDVDIYLANDFGEFIVPNLMYENQYPNLNFNDVSASTGADIGLYGMGLAVGDYDLDGDFDYYISNLGRNVLIENGPNNQFTDVTNPAGVTNTYSSEGLGFLTTSWGTAFLDYNNDRHPDLFVCNGQIPAAEFINTGALDPNKLYLNNGNKTFTDISAAAGIDDVQKGRGMAYSDYDQDGDLDIVTVVINRDIYEAPNSILYRNDVGNSNNWIQFKLEGVQCNRDAYGCKVRVHTNGLELVQEVSGGSSHASQNSSILHFGLQNATSVDMVEIDWLGGDTETFYNVPANQLHHYVENVAPPSCAVPTNITTTVYSGNVAKIIWDEQNDVIKYRIRYRKGSGALWTEVQNSVAYRFLNNLSPETTYEYQVKTNCTSINSEWSGSRFFTTLSDLCDYPYSSNVSSITNNSAVINWSTQTGVLKWKIKYKAKVPGSSWVEVIVNTNSKVLSELLSSTSYKYALKSKCAASWVNWNPKQEFTTASSKTGSSITSTRVGIYPNPTSDEIVLSFDKETTATIKVIDAKGYLLKTVNCNGFSKMIDLSDQNNGLYFLKINTGEAIITERVMKF